MGGTENECSGTYCILSCSIVQYTHTNANFQIQLLIEHEEVVAPDRADPLREILLDLGSAPSVEAFLGIVLPRIDGCKFIVPYND